MTSPAGESVAVVGAGSIGVAFAVLFAKAGFRVRVWDALLESYERSRADVDTRLRLLERHGLLGRPRHEIEAAITYESELATAVDGAVLVQECAPERVEIKRNIFSTLGDLVGRETVLASSSSALAASTFSAGLPVEGQTLVAHPGNPPYLLPVIETVPSPATRVGIVESAERIYRKAGLTPVRVRKEVEGFLFNRLQGALLREAYCLVRDGVASVADIDEVVKNGLGRRWSVIGPFETVDLNTRGGIESHAQKMGPAYERMGAERGQSDPWTADLVERVVTERRAILPLAEWEARVAWRDEQLMRIAASARE